MSETPQALVLFSGGLDSMLAIKILQAQGVALEAFNVRTQFECCKLEASRMAHEFGIRITVADAADDYLDLVRHPKNGWGKGINPCVDCRAYMFRLAARYAQKIGASFLVTGEVMGQRPNSQLRHQLAKVEEEAGFPRRILRPLSAKLLPPTVPEEQGLVDREKLYDFSGRGRGALIDLARSFGIEEVPQPSTGCRLTEPHFAFRAKEAWAHEEAAGRWEYELLKLGRHLRLPSGEKVVIGRNEKENSELAYLRERLPGAALYEPWNFLGPSALSVSGDNEGVRAFVGGALLRYGKKPPAAPLIRFHGPTDAGNFTVTARPLDDTGLRQWMV